MFNFFRKKTCNDPSLLAMIDKHGVDENSFHIAKHLVDKYIATRENAYLFILQELDGASQGNAKSIKFVESSGISKSEYKGALGHDMPECVDQASFYMVGISNGLHPLQELIVDVRLHVLFYMMDCFSIGKPDQLKPLLGLN